MGDLNNRNLFSHSSGGWKSKVKVQAGFIPFWGLFLACRGPSSHWVSSLCVVCVLIFCSPLIRALVLLDESPSNKVTHMTLLSCNYLLKALSSIQSYSGILGLRTSACEFWAGHSSTHNTGIRGLHLYSTTWQAVMLLGFKSIWVTCWDLSLTVRLKVASCSSWWN